MISVLISLLVLVIVVGIVFWIISLLPLPQPWLNIVKVIVGLIVLLVVLSWLLPMAGWPHPVWHN